MAAATKAQTVAGKPAVECAAPECAVMFTPKRSTAKYCGVTCRKRAARARRAAVESVEADVEGGKAEHALVRVTWLELQTAGVVETVDGQLALQMARKLTNPEETGFSALSKEFRAVLAAAKGTGPGGQAGPAGATEPDPEEDDEVTRARKAREDSRQAAGL